ncbi:SnoaL-like domain-containing protein [Armillaria luteobubalina]|uniref:SnoaL-like domain-containing protein n=1 Tax=Armillaria luteobubalina TaxID=153913 RepID=A0AA39UQY4_9AGAR|nr:SnoaL-like domain-containing protein [Armillaria luteobubalina]
MSSYSAIHYLLDKANIHDTVTKMMLYVDLLRWDDIENEVFTDDVRVDYTSLLSREALNVTSNEQVKLWKGIMKRLEKSQHITTSLLIGLPQPGSVPPSKDVRVTANVAVTVVPKEDGEGLVQNGGRYLLEVSRVAVSDGGNPWRISSLEVDLVYSAGNKDFYKGKD